MKEPLLATIYTIYDNPADFPGKIVVKRFRVHPSGPVQDPSFLIQANLETCRNNLKQLHLTNVGRQADDDVVIVESWI